MFGNLIESGSHTGDLTRKGSFFLGTLGIYAVLLSAAGVVSIYAYDAHLTQYEQVEVMMLPPIAVEPDAPRPEPARNRPSETPADSSVRRPQVVTEAFTDVTTPNIPTQISTAPGVPPVKGPFVIGKYNAPAIGPSVSGSDRNSGGSGGAVVATIEEPPPVVKVEPPPAKQKLIQSIGVIESKAISKPSPPYPVMAKAARVSGPVTVQIIVDEVGKVVSARALKGHPLLVNAAVQAAYQARFTPTLLSKQPVKVSGIITYNFVLQ